MKSDLIYYILALAIGALIPIMASTNAAFSRSIGNASITSLMVFIIGLISVTVFVLVSRASFPSARQLAAAPSYGYLGGIIVATYIVMITILVPRIGVGTAIALIVTGQIICAVTIDHFGLFNVAVRSIDLPRITGVLLMIGGIYLVMKKF